MTRNGVQFASPGSTDSYVLLAAHSAQRARDGIQELESTLWETRDRIQQSQQKLATSDRLIGDLSHVICQGKPHPSPNR